MLGKLRHYWRFVEQTLLVGVLLIIIFTAVLQIVLRNFFDTSLFWIDPLNRILVLWIALLGAMVATSKKEHIAIDFLQHYLKGVSLNLMLRMKNVFSGALCALMAFHSGRFVWDEYLYETTTFSNLPIWPFEVIMPLGFGVMALRFFVYAFAAKEEVKI